jgi:hypothetical protein
MKPLSPGGSLSKGIWLNSFFSQVERCFDLFSRVWWGRLKMKHGEGFGLPMLPNNGWKGFRLV